PEIPSGRVYTYYYFSSFTTPSTFSVPWLVLKTLRDFRFQEVAALGGQASGMRYWDAANPDGVPFAGDSHPVAADSDHDWWVMSGAQGTCLHALVIPDQWRDWGIKRGIVFQDHGEAAPDGVRDPGAGYSLLRMTNLRKPGAYQIDSALIVLSRPYQPGDEAAALAALRSPLQVAIRTIPATR